MKTLKKTLCLVLAVVMMLGTLAVAASAVTFTDDAEIKYTEAVDVLSGIGIITGKGDDKFDPNGTLTRAEAAKILACMLGYSDVKAVSTFDDVKGHWGESWIAYCAKQGIVLGVGNNKFDPDGTLTGHQWAKMVLVALGYDDEENGMVGDNWDVAVDVMLKSVKLTADIADFDGTDYITRDEACEVAFTALCHTAAAAEGYPVKKNGTAIAYYASIVEAAAACSVMDTADTDPGNVYTYGVTKEADLSVALAAKFNLLKDETPADNGQNGYKWYINKDNVVGYNKLKDVYVSDFVVTDTVVGTYTVANKQKEIAADLGVTAGNVTGAKFVNGAADGNVSFAYGSTDTATADSNETLVVVKTAADTYNFLYTQEGLYTVSKGTKVIDTASENYGLYPYTFTKVAGYGAATVAVYAADGAYDTDTYYVGVAKSGTLFLDVAAAKTVAGKLTATADKYIRIAGEKVNVVANSVYNAKIPNATYTYYLNTAGDVMYIGTYTDAATIYDGYAYVQATEYLATAYSATGVLNGAKDATIVAKANIVTAEGEAKTVALNTKIASLTVGNQAQVWNGTEYVAATINNDEIQTGLFSGWKAYTVEADGSYKFYAVAASNIESAAEKGATFTVSPATYYMDANTVISFYKYNTDTKAIEKSSVKGYANITADIATALNAATGAVVTANTSKVVSAIDVYDTTVSATTVNFAVYAGLGEDDADLGQYYNFYVGGELKSYLIATAYESAFEALVGGTLAVGDIVDIVTGNDGKVTSAAEIVVGTPATITAVTTNVKVASIAADGTYFVDGTGAAKTLVEGYVVYDTATNLYVEAELVANEFQKVTTYATEKGVIAIFITTSAA